MILLHEAITMAEVQRLARAIDARLVQDLNGNVVITPRRLERHGNSHVVRMPRRKRQLMHCTLPAAPEVTT